MKKKILISVCAVIILAMILALCSALVVPKRTEERFYEGRLVEEYYDEAGEHDVLFVGDCEVYESFVPAVLWEKYGISSYVRGSPQQLVWQSYYLLEEMLKYESPKVVVYNVLALKYGEPQDYAMNRLTLDGMKWSMSKVRAINASMTEEESFIEYVFPLLGYHSRITELEADDFKYAFSDPDPISESGYLMKTGILPMEGTIEDNKPSIPPSGDLPDTAMEYLEKIRILCEENGCELLLIKAPTNSENYWWYDEWDEQIVNYANEKGITYKNFIPLADEIGIDWSTDTYDYGLHLNVYGAEKMSAYIGEILADEYSVPDRSGDGELSDRWQARVDRYYANKKIMENNENE